jgi:hypothetical protein
MHHVIAIPDRFTLAIKEVEPLLPEQIDVE